MKRFFIDGILVVILVAIGNNFVSVETDPFDLDERIAHFEKNINQHEILNAQIEANPIQSLDLNQASKAALWSGEMIEVVVGMGVGIVSSVFKAIVE